jgi:hypothetical protein
LVREREGSKLAVDQRSIKHAALLGMGMVVMKYKRGG